MLRKAAPHDENADYDAEAHHRTPSRLRRAIVLLTNNGILPCPRSAEATDRPLAVTALRRDPALPGRRLLAREPHPPRPRSRRSAGAGEVPFARGFAAGGAEDDDALRAEAVELARAAGTVVLFLGSARTSSPEGRPH